MTNAPNTAIVPTPKIENDFYDWYARHAEKQALVAGRKDFDIVFIGDSITHLFEVDALDTTAIRRGGRVWREFYGHRKPLNLGFGWDRTQNVLWRLQHGEFEGLTPRLVVLAIGSNNLTGTANARTNTAEEIAEGLTAIVRLLHERSLSTRILLMGVLPRSTPEDPLRAEIRRLNTLLARIPATQPFVRFMDIGDRFIGPDGQISREIMNDLCHPTEPGYRFWAEAIEPEVRRWVEGQDSTVRG